MKLIFRLTCLLFSSIAISQITTVSSNNNVVGLEHNMLFNADKRYAVTQVGNSLPLNVLFDGAFEVAYTPTGISPQNPYSVTIENLPATHHTQIGAWIGWSTRYYRAINFKIEGYDQFQSANVWRTLADYSTVDYNSNQFVVKLPVAGVYSKLKFTFYRTDDSTNGRLGLSELFFLHPEGTTPYKGLFTSEQDSWIKNGTSLSYNGGNVGIGTNTPNAKLEIPALLDGQTFTDFNDGYKKSLLLNIGAYRDGYNRLLTFSDIPTSNIKPKAETWFAIEDRNDMNRFRHYAQTNGPSNFILHDNRQKEVFKVAEVTQNDCNFSHITLPEANTRLIIGKSYQDTPESGTYKLIVKNGSCINPTEPSTGNAFIEGNLVTMESVGIGTSSFVDPTNNKKYSLSVKGNIRAAEVKVYNTWADYVFAKEYKLKPLAEVESYIKENNHLPNVPSAKEVTEKGLELGEMTKIQQEKIEELTLYLIQQNKEIQELKAQVKALLEKKQ